jgi:hypothetical protein
VNWQGFGGVEEDCSRRRNIRPPERLNENFSRKHGVNNKAVLLTYSEEIVKYMVPLPI